MKTITLISWCLLGLYTVTLIGVLLFARSGSVDDRLATAYIVLLFIPLGILAAINLLPFQFTRIVVLVVCAAPAVMGVLMLVAGPTIQKWRSEGWAQEDTAMANGSYYFKDAPRQKLAVAIAALDAERLRSDLEQPVPNLNKTARDQVTLFDFATMQGFEADPARMIACFEVLLKKGAKIDNGDPAHSPTHFRVLGYSPELLKWFLENGADANALDAESRSPILFHAVCGENSEPARPLKAERVRLLLEHGADPNAIIPKRDELTIQSSTLLTAADMELWEICHMLLDFGADADYHTESGWNLTKAVDYQLQQHRSWGKTPPEELTRLAERLNARAGTNKPQ